MSNTTHPAATRPRPFPTPRPNRPLMWALGIINRWSMLEGLPLLRRVPALRDLPTMRGHFRIRAVDFPDADRARLADAVNADTAAFLAPNHPEFGMDWMMDKEISRQFVPRMASWAAHEIIKSAPGFWTRNNLISNDGGEAAIEYSVTWSLRGHGVLLHPEGSVHWTADRIHPLFRGIVEMATEAARRAGSERRVFIAPLIWKLRYVNDVSEALHGEMRFIESTLGLPRADVGSLADRFRRLQEGVLERQMRRFHFDPSSTEGMDFFTRQDSFRDHLVADLLDRYGVEPTESLERTLGRVNRAINARAVRDVADVKRAAEAKRLAGFTRSVYGTPSLTQEQIGESLKRLRAALVGRGVRNAVHNYLPAPYGPRVAHVRVPEPILVDAVQAGGVAAARAAYAAGLLEETRAGMQAALDTINREIEPEVSPFRIANPFATRAPNPPDLAAVSRLGDCRPDCAAADFAGLHPSLSRSG